MVSLKLRCCVRDCQGLVAIFGLYALLTWMFIVTVYYGVFGQTFDEDPLENSTTSELVNGVFFTILFALMIWSHVTCVITDPGQVPKGYEKLNEEYLPDDFYDLIRERESIYAEHIIKKKMRNNELAG